MAAASSADVRDTAVQKIAKSSKVKTLDVMKPQAAIPVNPMVKR
jgi:beta-glucosidase